MAPACLRRRVASAIAGFSAMFMIATAAPAAAQSPLSSFVSVLSDAEQRLRELELAIGGLQELGNKAAADLRIAQADVAEANTAVNNARAVLKSSTEALAAAQAQLNELSRSAYRQGSSSTPLAAMSSGDALDRSSYLRQQVQEQQRVVEDLQAQRTEHANDESRLRAQLQEAEEAERVAAQADENARSQIAEVSHELQDKQQEHQELVAERDQLSTQISSLRGETGEPKGDDPKPTEVSTPSSVSSASSGSGASGQVSSSSDIEAVIDAAKSQIGVPYAWGGGDANGPTAGLSDGGIADSFGDSSKVGFDCSGLVLYAFAQVGIELPHFSGYQYWRGEHIDPSNMQRGDLIFYGPNGEQHVAIYLGGGQMIEAPFSGGAVRVTEVRYTGMSPHVVRLL